MSDEAIVIGRSVLSQFMPCRDFTGAVVARQLVQTGEWEFGRFGLGTAVVLVSALWVQR